MKIEIASGQIQGQREYQQDVYAYREINDEAKLFVLADGMGGYKGGEIASELVLKTFMNERGYFVHKEALTSILEQANDKIKTYKEVRPDVCQMGTTLIALLVEKEKYYWVSVGDSPLYSIQDNQIERINQNHSVAGLLDLQVKQGEISAKEAKEDKNRHLLTSALMGEKIPMIDVSKTFNIKGNEVLLLASDGIETLSEEEILETVNHYKDNLEKAVEKLLHQVEKKRKSHQDNTTVLMLSFTSKEKKNHSFIQWIKRIIK